MTVRLFTDDLSALPEPEPKHGWYVPGTRVAIIQHEQSEAEHLQVSKIKVQRKSKIINIPVMQFAAA